MGSFYDYYRLTTDSLGDLPVLQYKHRDHMRSELLADVDALTRYFTRELGLRKGDAFTLFCRPWPKASSCFWP